MFSPDGRYLFGSSYYTGVSNIFRYEVATGELEALTNAETGFFRPVPLDDGSLLVFRYTGEGFVPAIIAAAAAARTSAPITFFGKQLVEKHPVLKQWAAGSPGAVPIESMITRTRRLQPAEAACGSSRSIRSSQGYKDAVAYGAARAILRSGVAERRQRHGVRTRPPAALPASERAAPARRLPALRLDTGTRRWNGADFYDLFGPTKTSRRGYEVGARPHATLLIFDEPRRLTLKVDGRLAGNLDQLPEYQNVPVQRRTGCLRSPAICRTPTCARRSAAWTTRRGSSGRWSMREDVVASSLFTKVRGDATTSAFALPIGALVALAPQRRPASRRSDASEPFANFYFGGFGNNYVDHRDEKRYREYYALPGAELNEIGGRNFVEVDARMEPAAVAVPPRRHARVLSHLDAAGGLRRADS